MRTTIRIDDNLLTEVKKRAAETHTSITAVIEKALRELFQKKSMASVRRVRLKTFKGQGLQEGVDLDHSGSLLDLMEDRA